MTNLGDPYTPEEEHLNRVFDRLRTRIAGIIMTAADNSVSAVTDQLNKALGELQNARSAMQAALDDANSKSLSDDVLTGLQDAAQRIDDLNPDQPAEPTPEPTPEPAPDSTP